MRAPLLILLLGLALVPFAPAQEAGTLFDDVARHLARDFVDKPHRRGPLREAIARLRPEARAARSVDEERGVVQELLATLPASHVALLSDASHASMMRELGARPAPTFGFQLVQLPEGWFATWILEGGPAQRAGLRRGDRVLGLDGIAPARSARLDLRTDDASLPDPPQHAVLVGERPLLRLLVARGDQRVEVDVQAASYSAHEATLASRRRYRLDGVMIGYLHFWYVSDVGLARQVRDALRGPLAGSEALVIDLRGRGGYASEALELVRYLERRLELPLVALIDDTTRSAKEVIADALSRSGRATLVGERTAGAVVPATFREVSGGHVLMYPTGTLGRTGARLEGTGVAPDVEVQDDLARAAGRDPILAGGLVVARDRVTL